MLGLGLSVTLLRPRIGAEPPDPTAPTESIDPTDPTESTEPTGPTEPTPPVEPMPFERVAESGWAVTASAPAEAVGKTFDVQRAGHDASGAAVTVTDRLKITARRRLPYPNHASLTTDTAVLSEFIYAGDRVGGAENASTRAVPKPIAAWLCPDLEIIDTASYTARLTVAHACARHGRPVAAVKFILSDGTTRSEATVAAMSAETYALTGLSVPHFAADLSLAGFSDGAVLTLDAILYPWVGAAFQISTDAAPYPAAGLSTMKILCNQSGSWGRAYAYVDPVAGTSGGAVSTTAATAAAAPFQTILQAATAIRAFNNSHFSRNFTDGGIIRLVEGTTVLTAAIRAAGVTQAFPLVIEAADPAKAASTIFADRGTTLSGSIPDHLVLRNLALKRGAAGSVIFLDQQVPHQTYATQLVLEGCSIDEAGFGTYSSWIHRCGRVFLRDCSGALGLLSTATPSSANKTFQLQGCDGGANSVNAATLWRVFGSKLRSTNFGNVSSGTAITAPYGCFYGWNALRNEATGGAAGRMHYEIGPQGLAVIGNTFEVYGPSTQAALQISADGVDLTAQNVVVQGNSCIGERVNLLYNDGGLQLEKIGYVRGNVLRGMNIKSDLFSAAAVTGNWAARYKVAWSQNAVLQGADDSKTYGPEGWIGELPGIGEVAGTNALPVATDWADDRSNTGSDTGEGDYTPGPLHALPRLPAGTAPYPTDQRGRVIPDDGSAVAGALQPR